MNVIGPEPLSLSSETDGVFLTLKELSEDQCISKFSTIQLFDYAFL